MGCSSLQQGALWIPDEYPQLPEEQLAREPSIYIEHFLRLFVESARGNMNAIHSSSH